MALCNRTLVAVLSAGQPAVVLNGPCHAVADICFHEWRMGQMTPTPASRKYITATL